MSRRCRSRTWPAIGPPSAARKRTAKALRYVADAGRMALEQLAPDEALDWFQRAIELGATVTVDPGEHRELLIGLGMAQLQAGRPEFRETLLGAARAARAAETATGSSAPGWPTAAATSAPRASSTRTGSRCWRRRSTTPRPMIPAAPACSRCWPPNCCGRRSTGAAGRSATKPWRSPGSAVIRLR